MRKILAVLLLALLATRYFAARSDAREAWRDCVSVFEENGITLGLDEAPKGEGLAPLRAVRDKAAETAAAALVLGEMTSSEPGGGVVLCNGALGGASFRVGGEFSVTLEAGTVSAGTQNEGEHALSLLKKMGLKADAGSLNTAEAGRETWVFRLPGGMRRAVFSCTASFVLSERRA
jgi:hypothetical protein